MSSRPLTEKPRFLELSNGVSINETGLSPHDRKLFTPEVVRLIADLHHQFEPERQKLLNQRIERQYRYNQGGVPDYPNRDSEAVRGDWRVAPIPADLQCRRVEITGPVNNTKMVINMLSRNSQGQMADTAMLDFEDSMKPCWPHFLAGVQNCIGAADGTLSYRQPAGKNKPVKFYHLNPQDMPVIMIRVRGLHLEETNVQVDGQPVSGGLLELVLCIFHTAATLLQQKKTPKYYIPKVEHYLEARWWNRLFIAIQEAAGLLLGTLRATFLIETLPAAFQMEEILYEIRDHAAGLNVGRWDKIFSDIKTLRHHPDRILADRGSVDLSRPWMANYARRLIKICHERGAFAMGGMAAFTPGREPETVQRQVEKVIADKKLESEMGHDGCWVSHPYFIGPAMSAFGKKNQLDVLLPEFDRYPDLLPAGSGPRTLAGLRKNIRVGIAYLNGWNQGIGCVAWDNLMEDLATLEISRAQVWQWLHHEVRLDSGEKVVPCLVKQIFREELSRILGELQAGSAPPPPVILNGFRQATVDAQAIFLKSEFDDFLSSSSEVFSG